MEEKSIAQLFLKMARNFIGIGELELSLKTCERGIQRFPDDSNLHSLHGSILVTSYKKTKNQNSLIEALKSFEKSLSINPDNYMASMLAAKIYFKGKFYQNARQKLQMILETSPGDVKASDLLKQIDAKEDDSQSGASMKGTLILDPDEELEGRSLNISINSDLLISYLSLLTHIEGQRSVILLDKNGIVIKSINKTKLNTSDLGTIVSNIFRSSKDLMHRTGLGPFKMGVLIIPDQYIYLVSIGNAILALVADPEADHTLIERRIKRYINEILSQWE